MYGKVDTALLEMLTLGGAISGDPKEKLVRTSFSTTLVTGRALGRVRRLAASKAANGKFSQEKRAGNTTHHTCL